mmetsp:Transcript_36535/g.64036  ORF Transcript_36535/g.64036 Transcript_36535/m.64036 type:complete len:113 (-) Transcript_36535:15-353(-)
MYGSSGKTGVPGADDGESSIVELRNVRRKKPGRPRGCGVLVDWDEDIFQVKDVGFKKALYCTNVWFVRRCGVVDGESAQECRPVAEAIVESRDRAEEMRVQCSMLHRCGRMR